MSFGAAGHQLPWKVLEIYYPVISFPFFWSQVTSSCKSLHLCLCNLFIYFFWYVNSMNLQCSFLSHLLLAWGLIGFSGLALPAFDKGEILSAKWWLQIATLAHRVWLGLVHREKPYLFILKVCGVAYCCYPWPCSRHAFVFPLWLRLVSVASQGTCMVLVRGRRSWSVI